MARSKTNTIQVNKQIVKFNYPSSCRKRVRPRKKDAYAKTYAEKYFSYAMMSPKLTSRQ